MTTLAIFYEVTALPQREIGGGIRVGWYDRSERDQWAEGFGRRMAPELEKPRKVG